MCFFGFGAAVPALGSPCCSTVEPEELAKALYNSKLCPAVGGGTLDCVVGPLTSLVHAAPVSVTVELTSAWQLIGLVWVSRHYQVSEPEACCFCFRQY